MNVKSFPLYSRHIDQDPDISAFIGQDKKTILIHTIALRHTYELTIFYDDIVPNAEKNGDRFTGLDVDE
jgi:hypothetical protein